MKISIVTPHRNGVSDLLADYARATEGAEIVTVDNASNPADADALRGEKASLSSRLEELRAQLDAERTALAARLGAGAKPPDRLRPRGDGAGRPASVPLPVGLDPSRLRASLRRERAGPGHRRGVGGPDPTG